MSPILIGTVLTVFILSLFVFLKMCIANLLKNCKDNTNQNDVKITQQSVLLSSSNNKEDTIKVCRLRSKFGLAEFILTWDVRVPACEVSQAGICDVKMHSTPKFNCPFSTTRLMVPKNRHDGKTAVPNWWRPSQVHWTGSKMNAIPMWYHRSLVSINLKTLLNPSSFHRHRQQQKIAIKSVGWWRRRQTFSFGFLFILFFFCCTYKRFILIQSTPAFMFVYECSLLP